MDNTSLLELIHKEIPDLRVRTGEPMDRHCSFKIGGPAEAFAEVESEAQAVRLFELCKNAGAPLLVIGRGTNLLVCDEGVSGVVMRLGGDFLDSEVEGTEIYAGAVCSLSRVASLARGASLTGLEFAHGIPGSLGGGLMMNAGAYGGEMKDITASVRCLDSDGVVREYAGEELDFSYRHSRFCDSGGVILSACLRLERGGGAEIEARMRELMEKRAASQPLDRPSAGSTFKRPATGYAAAMIDAAGLKGFQIGGAAVSEKHAGFVVNNGGARFADVTAVMEHVKKTVFDKYGVELEPEVRIIRRTD